MHYQLMAEKIYKKITSTMFYYYHGLASELNI